MSTAFHCVEHVVSCQHTREYPNATESEEGALSLAVKQYIPHDNRSPQAGDVTVLAAHANGLPKVSSNEFLLKQEGLKGGKGNIRATLGRDLQPMESQWHPNSWYLDSRCRQPGAEWSNQRVDTRK